MLNNECLEMLLREGHFCAVKSLLNMRIASGYKIFILDEEMRSARVLSVINSAEDNKYSLQVRYPNGELKYIPLYQLRGNILIHKEVRCSDPNQLELFQ
jgi:hypothetical protein